MCSLALVAAAHFHYGLLIAAAWSPWKQHSLFSRDLLTFVRNVYLAYSSRVVSRFSSHVGHLLRFSNPGFPYAPVMGSVYGVRQQKPRKDFGVLDARRGFGRRAYIVRSGVLEGELEFMYQGVQRDVWPSTTLPPEYNMPLAMWMYPVRL